MVDDFGTVGVWLSSQQVADDRTESAVALLDELGFGTLWLGSSAPGLGLPERMLARTERITVATGIVSIWSMPAEQLGVHWRRLYDSYGSRFLLGIGVGHPKYAKDYQRPYTAMVDYLDALDHAGVPVHGRVLAALGPKVLALAGSRAAGAHPYLITPEHTARARAVLGAGPLLAPEQKVVLDTDPASARQTARDTLARYLELPNYLANLRRLGYGDADFADGGSDRMVDDLVAWGDVDAVLDRVRAHRDAGADHVALQVLGGDTPPLAAWRDLAAALSPR